MAAAAVAVGKILVPGEAVALEHPVAPVALQSQPASTHRQFHRRRPKYRFTNYEVTGHTSTFGAPTDYSGSVTADGGSTERACIALRNDNTLRHRFLVTVLTHHTRHQAVMPQCDWGPATFTGRNIDITGAGVTRLHLNPWTYPTGSWGIARELAGKA